MWIYILIGTILMGICGFFQSKLYKVEWWKSLILTICFTGFGVLGTFILCLVETGKWGGTSFYGSVLFIPLLVIPLKFILKIDYKTIVSMAAPQICLMLGVMKINCATAGCCYGILIDINGELVKLPIQIIESVLGFVLAGALIALQFRKIWMNYMYEVFLISYGIMRLVINFFRGDIEAFVWILPAGHLWSIVAILSGLIWIILNIFVFSNKKELKNEI